MHTYPVNYYFLGLDKKLSTLFNDIQGTSTMNDQLEKIWKNVMQDLQKKISPTNFHTLFKNTHLISLEENIATIAAPSTMIIDLLQKRFAKDIQTLLSEQCGKEVSLLFIPKVFPQKRPANKDPPFFTS